jgi:uncharacterized phiE125 gp8 family phage protein
MKYSIATGPAFEPVTLVEAKAQLRVDHNDEDALIESLISVARRKVESETGRLLAVQTVDVYYDEWPAEGYVPLPLHPAASVTHVKYIDEDGALQTWASTNYTSDLIGQTPRIVPNPDTSLPDLGEYPNAVQVRYTVGDSTAGAIPEELKHAIKLTLTMLYERREDMSLKDPGSRSSQWLAFNHRTNLV